MNDIIGMQEDVGLELCGVNGDKCCLAFLQRHLEGDLSRQALVDRYSFLLPCPCVELVWDFVLLDLCGDIKCC
jgi:hypothetical protein